LHSGILNPAFFGTTHTCLVALAIEHVSSYDVMGFEGLQSEVQSCRLDGRHVRTCCLDSGPSLDRSRPHFHTIHVFLPKRPPLSFHQSRPPRLPSALLHSTVECFRGRQRWWMAMGGGGCNGGRGARWQRQRDERERGGNATTSQRQRGATRDTRLDERTREGRLDERGAVQCARRWQDKRGGDVTISRHERGVARRERRWCDERWAARQERGGAAREGRHNERGMVR
jgi:hypothetical protein